MRSSVWGAGGVFVPMLIAASMSVLQAPENVAAGAIILRGRYDVRGAFLAVSMALRLTGIAVGCQFGVTGAVAGMAIAQVAATAAIGTVGIIAFRRFPQVAAEPIAEDRPALRRFVLSSSIASSLDSARGTLGTSLVPTVAPIVQAGYFSSAQSPATGFAALSGPVRLVMLTEQTRDFEAGRHDRVFGMLRRYIQVTVLLMLVAVPVLWWLMPFLIGITYGHAFRVHATNAARLVLLVAALRLAWGWTKSFPVSIGRPEPADRRAGDRDRGVHPAPARLRVEMGRHRRRGSDARLDGRLLRRLVVAAAPAAGGPQSPGAVAS